MDTGKGKSVSVLHLSSLDAEKRLEVENKQCCSYSECRQNYNLLTRWCSTSAFFFLPSDAACHFDVFLVVTLVSLAFLWCRQSLAMLSIDVLSIYGAGFSVVVLAGVPRRGVHGIFTVLVFLI